MSLYCKISFIHLKEYLYYLLKLKSKEMTKQQQQQQAANVIHKYYKPHIDLKNLDEKHAIFNDLYNHQFATIPVMITTLFQPFIISWVNDAFTHTFGWTLNEIHGRTPKVLQGKYTKYEIAQFKKRCCTQLDDTEFPVTLQTINHDKSKRPVLMNITIDFVWDIPSNGPYEGFVTFMKKIDYGNLTEDKIIYLAKYIISDKNKPQNFR